MPALAARYSTAPTKSTWRVCSTKVNTSPPWSQPKHLYRPVCSRTLNDGLFSAWNGHRPTQLRPTRRSCTTSPTTSTIDTAARRRSTSSWAIAIAGLAVVGGFGHRLDRRRVGVGLRCRVRSSAVALGGREQRDRDRHREDE